MQQSKKKIAILGSGMSALTSAYELTSYENWQDHYEITIYQMGWRLGGKTATGRGPKERIQEHGIHIAQGWYENAFRLIQDSYKECEKHNLMPNSPFKSWEDAFDQENTTLLTHFDKDTNTWIRKNIIFPSNDYIPGQGGPLPFSEIVKKVLGLLKEILFGINPNQKGLAHHLDDIPEIDFKSSDEEDLWDKIKDFISDIFNGNGIVKEVEKGLQYLEDKVLDLVDGKEGTIEKGILHNIIKHVLNTLLKWFHLIVKLLPLSNEYFYWLAVFAEFALVSMKGTFEDIYNPDTHELDYEKINHLDFREWLKNNGASDRLLESAVVRFLYTGTFHNLTGKEQNGSLAAGVAMHFLTLSVGYKGAFVWKFKAGTADTMITPIYLVLKHRGVKFKFFQKVEQVHYSPSGEIERVSMAEQVTLKNGDYVPTYEWKGIEVWPGEPRYEQINDKQAEKLKEDKIDLEMAWSNWKNVKDYELVKGSDFDYVILGIPINVLSGDQGICKEIIANNQKWNDMVTHVKSIPTMSMQLWIKPNLKELGMELKDWGFPEGSLPNLVTYASPQYSWIDMSQVMPFEDWNGKGPGLLVYYTGSFLDPEHVPPYSDAAYPNEQLERVMRISEQWLRDNMGWFFPKAPKGDYPQGMSFSIIHDFSGVATEDYAILKTQYFRANVNPTDRYTLSLPNTNQYRLKVDETGFENLVITGDWTDFGVNVGYYEGAIISGLQAGQAVRKKLNLELKTEIFAGVIFK